MAPYLMLPGMTMFIICIVLKELGYFEAPGYLLESHSKICLAIED